jgi:limonene-1,2-epoxide hydrolase
MSHSKIIEDFIGAWNAKDIDKVMSFFTAECVYHNIPMAPVQGTEAIRGVIDGFAGMASEIEWELHEVAETSAGTVLTERTDKFLIGEKWVALPVMGSFQFEGDKVSVWKDYFDMNQFQSQIGG